MVTWKNMAHLTVKGSLPKYSLRLADLAKILLQLQLIGFHLPLSREKSTSLSLLSRGAIWAGKVSGFYGQIYKIEDSDQSDAPISHQL